MSTYEDLDLTLDTDALFQAAVDYIQSVRPNWIPNEAHFEVIVLSAIAQMAYEQAFVASLKPQGIFRYFGEDLNNLPALEALPASGSTTWAVSDTVGHTIPAGTQLVVGGEFGFQVVSDVVIPPGSTSTAAGEVEIQALEPGADQNGLTGTVELVDAFDWVVSVTLAGTTAGGQDPESDQDYEDRLTDLFKLQAPRPITPTDYEIMTRQQPGVTRALAIDGYNPANQTYDNERMVAVAVIDDAGQPLSSAIKSSIDAVLQSYREVNFVVNVIDPTYTPVTVAFTATALKNWDAAAVQSDAQAAVADYLSPANWGFDDEGDEQRWINQPIVRINELIALISNVSGIDYVTSVTIDGSAADLTLLGAAPLPTVGTITGSVS